MNCIGLNGAHAAGTSQFDLVLTAVVPEDLKAHAKAVGLDTAKFNQCLDSGKQAAKVKEDEQAGSKVGVSGTPAFFINGVSLSGAVPIEEFKREFRSRCPQP